jgi:hypothetical protein
MTTRATACSRSDAHPSCRLRAHRAWRATFRINRETVSKLPEGQGVPRRNRPLSPVQIEQATELYATGLSLVSVGKQLGCDGSTVHLALRKAGARMRDCQGRERLATGPTKTLPRGRTHVRLQWMSCLTPGQSWWKPFGRGSRRPCRSCK